MKKTKLHMRTAVRLNAYACIERAVDDGINYGWERAHKHTNNPGGEAIKTEIENGIMNELAELLIFDDNAG